MNSNPIEHINDTFILLGAIYKALLAIVSQVSTHRLRGVKSWSINVLKLVSVTPTEHTTGRSVVMSQVKHWSEVKNLILPQIVDIVVAREFCSLNIGVPAGVSELNVKHILGLIRLATESADHLYGNCPGFSIKCEVIRRVLHRSILVVELDHLHLYLSQRALYTIDYSIYLVGYGTPFECV